MASAKKVEFYCCEFQGCGIPMGTGAIPHLIIMNSRILSGPDGSLLINPPRPPDPKKTAEGA